MQMVRKQQFLLTRRQKVTFKEVKLVDGISAETAVKTVTEELDVNKVLHVSLGWKKSVAVWEVAFKKRKWET